MRLQSRLIVLAAIALGAASAGVAAATEENTTVMDPGEGRDCFRADSLRRYAIVDDHTIRVRFSPRRSYTLATSEDASDLRWGRQLRLSSDTGWVCAGDVRGAVFITGGDMGNRYGVDTVSRDPYPLPQPASEND